MASRIPIVLFPLLVGLTSCATGIGRSPPLPPANEAASGAGALVQPGDRIGLRVYLEEELTGQYPVNEEGYLVLPKLGPIRVSSVPVADLPAFLRELYAEYLRNPAVEVTVYRRIGVHGEVNEPSLYWLDVTMTLRDAIAMAGGVTEEGNPDRVILVRDDQRWEFEGYGRTALLTVGLHSGDQVIVERRGWMYLNAPILISASISVISILTAALITR